MSPSARHVILTRFSVTFTPDQPPPEEAWLRYRLAFFREAGPSLRGQSVKDFRWLVFCDARAPEWLARELGELADGDLFEVVWLDRPWSTSVVRESVDTLEIDGSHLITTRLDSDDALGIRFVETLQAQFDGLDLEYINLVRGLQLDRTGGAYRYDYPSNPFISLIERRTAGGLPRTVFFDPRHGFAHEHAKVTNVRSGPLWMQVVHGGNLANDVRGLQVSPITVRENFTIDLGYDDRLSGWKLRRAQVEQLGRLLLLWARRPGRAREAIQRRRAWRRAPRRVAETGPLGSAESDQSVTRP